MKRTRFFLVFLFSATAWAQPADFVDLKAFIPSLVMDVRYYTAHNFVGARVRGYDAPKCYMTRVAAKALKEVQEELLPMGLSLKIYDAYRPQRAVDHFVEWGKAVTDTLTKREFYPELDKKDVFKLGLINPRSSHSRGSAVDLTIVPLPTPEQEVYIPHENLRPSHLPADERFGDNSLDMGTGFDAFHRYSATVCKEVGPQARANRLLLKTLMEKHGFRNFHAEWWHFNYIEEPYPETYFDFPVN